MIAARLAPVVALVAVACSGWGHADDQPSLRVNSVERGWVGQGVQRFVPIVIVDVTISNPGIATGRVSYSESAFTALGETGLLYGPADAGRYEICEIEDVAEPPFRSGELRPGEEVRGRLVFHVEPGLKLETLRWHRTPSSEPVMAPLRLPTVIC